MPQVEITKRVDKSLDGTLAPDLSFKLANLSWQNCYSKTAFCFEQSL